MKLNNFYIAAQLPHGGWVDVGADLGVALDASKEFSLEAWVRLYETADGVAFLSCDNFFRFGADGKNLTLDIFGLPVASGSRIYAEMDTLDWHHVAATYDKQHMRLYIDGVCVVAAAISGKGSGTPGPFKLGQGMKGRLRGLRVFKSCLSADAISDSMFGTIDKQNLTTDIDLTRNPPADTKSPQRQIALRGGAAMLAVYPSLKLSGYAFARPSSAEGINPGSNYFDPYTVHAVLRCDAAHKVQYIFANSLAQVSAGMALYLEYDVRQEKIFVKSLRGSTIDDQKILVSRSSITPNQWVSVATTFNGESLCIYINGKKDAECLCGPILASSLEGKPVIGGRFLGGELAATDCLQGHISRLEVWDKALNESEITVCTNTLPAPASQGLVCLYDFSTHHVMNEVDNAPCAMSAGAFITEYTELAHTTVNSSVGEPTDAPLKNTTCYTVEPQLLAAFREQADFSLPAFGEDASDVPTDDVPLAQQATAPFSGLSAARLREDLAHILPEQAEALRVVQGIDDRMQELLAAGSLRFQVTQHLHEGEYFLVVHYPEHSYVAYRCSVDDIDECILLKIRLVFTIIVGIADILLGIKPVLNELAIKFIQDKVLNLPEIITVLSAGASISSVQLFSMGRVLVGKGLLKDLFKLVLTFSFWSLLRLTARLVLSFLGVGTGAMIVSLTATIVTFTILIVEFLKYCLPFPAVALYGIKFNHDVNQHNTSALNIRSSGQTRMRIPEWTVGYQDPVAYAINQIIGGSVSIFAKFTISSILLKTVNIRATASVGSVLGGIVPFMCTFVLGTSNYVPLQVTFAGANVGIGLAAWDWEYYDAQSQVWRSMGTSSNVVYLSMDTPQLPWTQNINNALALPTMQALEQACTWATGAGNVVSIAPQLGSAFLSDPKFLYAGLSYYATCRPSTGQLDYCLDRFLDDYASLLSVEIECSDCSGVVAILTRLLGGSINVVYFTNGGSVPTQCIRAIGTATWDTHDFNYHMINAFGAPFTNVSQVIDACVFVNGDIDPWLLLPLAVPATFFMPGALATPMHYTTQPVPAVLIPGYGNQTSYRERFLENTVNSKNQMCTLLTTFTLR